MYIRQAEEVLDRDKKPDRFYVYVYTGIQREKIEKHTK